MPEYRFRATPLSPVHIGTGESVGPEEYFLEQEGGQSRLARFSPPAVLSALDDGARARIEGMLNAGNAQAAVEKLRTEARGLARSVLYRCGLGPAAARFLQGWLTDPSRSRGEVRPLPHNPYDGSVVIPGSAVKGAFRTAVLNALVNTSKNAQHKARFHAGIEEASRDARQLGRKAMEIEETLIRHNRGIESDPFRFLKVEDAVIGAAGGSAVRVDEARVVYADRDMRQSGPPMYVERLLSSADRKAAPFEIRIRLSPADEIARAKAPWRMDLEWLLKVVDYFFRIRYQSESSRFPNDYHSVMPSIDQLSKGHLIRIGRYSHFECLSVEGLRRAFNRQKKTWITEGATRTVCELATGKRAPFGWVLLERLQ